MKLLILGATGRVGKEITTRALTDGHFVTILVRDSSKVDWITPNLSVIQGDACSEEDIFQAVQGVDAIISALGTDGGSVLTESIQLLIAAMKRFGTRRLITVGTAGILDSREYPGQLRYEAPNSRRSSTRAAEQHRQAWELLTESELDWSIVCPTYLPIGERTGVYRCQQDQLPEGGLSISVADTADFCYQQLLSNEFIRKRVGIAY